MKADILRKLTRKNVAMAAILLILAGLVIFLFAQNRHLEALNQSLASARQDFYRDHVSSKETTFVARLTSKDVHLLINAERRRAGMAELGYSEKLESSACAKADDMIANNYWAHVSPSGVEPWYFFSQQGILYRNAGENLGYGFSNGDGVVQGWMNSKTHKDNILNAVYTDEGICVKHADMYMNKPNQYVVVEHFFREL